MKHRFDLSCVVLPLRTILFIFIFKKKTHFEKKKLFNYRFVFFTKDVSLLFREALIFRCHMTRVNLEVRDKSIFWVPSKINVEKAIMLSPLSPPSAADYHWTNKSVNSCAQRKQPLSPPVANLFSITSEERLVKLTRHTGSVGRRQSEALSNKHSCVAVNKSPGKLCPPVTGRLTVNKRRESNGFFSGSNYEADDAVMSTEGGNAN